MAKEFTGVLLVMSAIFRSKAGQELLLSGRKRFFPNRTYIQDWTLLVETLLQWEQWLKSDEMTKFHVQRFKKKRKYIMFLIKKIGKRTVGMGFKVMKFHAIVHLAADILSFGVPMVVDTGSNESHHKITKVAAKLTQKEIKTFEKQVCDRMDDFHVLDLAMEEIKGRRLFDYFFGHEHPHIVEQPKINSTGGMKFVVFWDDERDKANMQVVTRMKEVEKCRNEPQLLEFLFNIRETIGVDNLHFCSEHTRHGVMFRSHPHFWCKGPWRDWVMIDWGQHGDFPAHIWCFLDLTWMEMDAEYVLPNGDKVGKGVYAIVESAYKIEDEDAPHSEIWTSIQLEVEELSANGEEVLERKFFVVDVEAFKDPLVVVSDFDAVPRCRYLMMTPRKQWATDFIAWIQRDHVEDEEEMNAEV
jgi:hypothetical protein